MIKKKTDVYRFINSFPKYAQWDGTKLYFVINHPQVTITLMHNPDERFTIHRKSEVFCDIFESQIEREELHHLIWRYRKFINRSIKEITKV